SRQAARGSAPQPPSCARIWGGSAPPALQPPLRNSPSYLLPFAAESSTYRSMHLRDDPGRRRRRVRVPGDRAADHEIVGAARDRIGGRAGAALIVLRRPGGADAGRADQQRLAAGEAADLLRVVLGRRDEPVGAARDGVSRTQAHELRERRGIAEL